MPKTRTAQETRQHAHELEIDARPAEVWKAITEAEELVRWFPLEAEVEPGENGHITYGWGEALRGTSRIRNWVPEEHLRTSWMAADDPEDQRASQLAVDWFLEGSGSGTRLRLVHSGFGPGEEWDEEFDGTRRGWTYELLSLKHYLEVHPGESRRSFWLRKPATSTVAQTWRRLIHPQGLIQSTPLEGLEPGSPVHLSLASGDRVDGRLLLLLAPTDVAFVVDNWNRGLFRAAHENCGQGPEVSLFVSLWGYPEKEAGALEQRLRRTLDECFR